MELRPDVVAGKYDPSKFDPLGNTLLINEIFYSLQGEGAHTGKATVFIRLAKCNLACAFCDTEFQTYEPKTVRQIVEQVNGVAAQPRGALPHVTLTGGEPLLQNCEQLVAALKMGGYPFITVETSGSVWNEWARDVDWRTVSPKVRYKDIPSALIAIADEYKWVVNASFLRMFEDDANQCWDPRAANYLQPEWGLNREKFTVAATKLIMRFPGMYRMSLQTHKLMGVP